MGVGGRLMKSFEPEDVDKGRAVVNTVMNLWVSEHLRDL